MSVLASVLAVAAGADPGVAELSFRAAGLAAGLTAERRPLHYSVADMTGGGAVGDFNRDGWQDLFLLGGGGAVDALYLNNGDGTFTDHAAAAGVAWSHRGLAAAVGDFDGDGWQDLYVTSLGESTGDRRPGAHRLYRNLGVPAAAAEAPPAARRTAPALERTATGRAGRTPSEHASPASVPAARASPEGTAPNR